MGREWKGRKGGEDRGGEGREGRVGEGVGVEGKGREEGHPLTPIFYCTPSSSFLEICLLEIMGRADSNTE